MPQCDSTVSRLLQLSPALLCSCNASGLQPSAENGLSCTGFCTGDLPNHQAFLAISYDLPLSEVPSASYRHREPPKEMNTETGVDTCAQQLKSEVSETGWRYSVLCSGKKRGCKSKEIEIYVTEEVKKRFDRLAIYSLQRLFLYTVWMIPRH